MKKIVFIEMPNELTKKELFLIKGGELYSVSFDGCWDYNPEPTLCPTLTCPDFGGDGSTGSCNAFRK